MAHVHEDGNAVLRGGPAALSADPAVENEWIVRVEDLEQTLKLPCGSHYDHYAPTAEWLERSGRTLRVFRWSRRTYVAE
ncbi:DUF5988 family protein [Streptomyces sp. LX-29]|uniref:DUF5988 family protein n=1 Tax=unclassified Streptomyces TaxID=2593676 RepID=UPI001185E8BA|nr:MULTISPECIES: DUF5988 family protein [unclassified Streptomyces]TVL89504.1 hypothetical protein CD790_26855 [Streptomyces sp. SAJ15]WFB11045.1 DUF5988 family protein [Streptomyces sp. LX-29]